MAGLSTFLGKYVIIRTDSAGVWAGLLCEKDGDEVILHEARRMWRWWAREEGFTLSECALHGVLYDKSRIVRPCYAVWLQAIEILPCSAEAEDNIRQAPHAKAQD